MLTSLFQLEQKPVTVFSSDDAGAPVLRKDPGSLKMLLKACLVTGYGDKTALGWQMLFESEDLLSAAFASQDLTASKFVFKIDNSATQTAKLSAYQSMTDINTGVKPLAVDNDYKLFSGSWRLIGHGKAFILLLDANVYNEGTVAYPILFGDLPREIKRAAPVVMFWTARSSIGYQASMQVTLKHNPNGNLKVSQYATTDDQSNYPFVVNHASGGANITKSFSRFDDKAQASAISLYDTYFCVLPDSTWTFIPMLQPMSANLHDVGNLGLLSVNAIKARTGDASLSTYTHDCAVPLDWWYA